MVDGVLTWIDCRSLNLRDLPLRTLHLPFFFRWLLGALHSVGVHSGVYFQ
jgi:hypothetical protein